MNAISLDLCFSYRLGSVNDGREYTLGVRSQVEILFVEYEPALDLGSVSCLSPSINATCSSEEAVVRDELDIFPRHNKGWEEELFSHSGLLWSQAHTPPSIGSTIQARDLRARQQRNLRTNPGGQRSTQGVSRPSTGCTKFWRPTKADSKIPLLPESCFAHTLCVLLLLLMAFSGVLSPPRSMYNP